MTSKLSYKVRYDVKMYLMKQKRASSSQKHATTSKNVIMSKIRHDVKMFVINSKTHHYVKNMSTVRHDIQSTP